MSVGSGALAAAIPAIARVWFDLWYQAQYRTGGQLASWAHVVRNDVAVATMRATIGLGMLAALVYALAGDYLGEPTDLYIFGGIWVLAVLSVPAQTWQAWRSRKERRAERRERVNVAGPDPRGGGGGGRGGGGVGGGRGEGVF
jgi:hypothetical protein